jgi:hypothetical protein
MRRFGTQLPQRFMCQPGPQRQPTVSIGKGALGLAIGMACEPAPDSIKVPAASAKGSKYFVNMRCLRGFVPNHRETRRTAQTRRNGMDHIFVRSAQRSGLGTQCLAIHTGCARRSFDRRRRGFVLTGQTSTFAARQIDPDQ